MKDLRASVEGKEILKGVSLTVEEGELHAIMGPNGSGKSTLVNTLMGHPNYEVTGGSVEFRGKDLLAMSADERAREGLFLAFQYPKEIAGVPLRSFLFAAYDAVTKARNPDYKKMSPIKFKEKLEECMHELKMNPTFADRPVNQGFSGGEKKKAEILQLKILQPLLALLDETDSGLDVDALKIVAEGINSLRSRPNPLAPRSSAEQSEVGSPTPNPSFILVTHYARILEYITPDRVHVMVDGKIIKSAGAEFARTIEKEGYEQFTGKKQISLN